MSFCGILPVDKPAGWTSHDVVAVARRLTRTGRAGHAGTLDPGATGVLPVFLGPATRLVEYLQAQPKEYTATVTLGASTTTYDAQGEVVERRPVNVSDATRVQDALPQFVGTIQQQPPAYSALKVEGGRAYDLARKGVLAELPARAVEVHALDLLEFRPGASEIDLRVSCGSGTYIRSLAHDLARALGTVGHLSALRRTRVGPFQSEACHTIDVLRQAAEEGSLPALVVGPDEAMLSHRAVILASDRGGDFGNGIRLACPGCPESVVRVYQVSGEFLGAATISQGVLRPRKVLAR